MIRPFQAFMVWTTATGGKLQCAWTNDRERYEEAKRTGRMNIAAPWAAEPEWVELKMVAYAPLEELRDFVLEPVGT